MTYKIIFVVSTVLIMIYKLNFVISTVIGLLNNNVPINHMQLWIYERTCTLGVIRHILTPLSVSLCFWIFVYFYGYFFVIFLLVIGDEVFPLQNHHDVLT